ncbi:MAG: sulfurtransferase [Rhodobacterales bacterium]|nr:MAG: sulfurtransferase [Rhodobacterales bacterium]
MLRFVAAALTGAILSSAAMAEVKITPDMAEASFSLNGQALTIARNQDPEARLDDTYAKTSRDCPPFCIHPMSAADGVETIGELEVIDFLKTRVAAGEGLLIDTRVPDWFNRGTIPGAVNVPFTTLESSNPYRDDILKALGAVERGGNLDFTDALDLAMFCNGAWCDQTPRAIHDLIAAGYPADRIHYYRGGMQMWLVLGLTVQTP